jgi:hypothetical protein
MDDLAIKEAVVKVRERLEENSEDAALFEVLEDTAREDDGIIYVPIKLRHLVNAARRYEIYGRFGEIEAEVGARLKRPFVLLPVLSPMIR